VVCGKVETRANNSIARTLRMLAPAVLSERES
jgi:hypothetical protein